MKVRNRTRRRKQRGIAAPSLRASVELLEPRLLMSAAFGDRVDLPVGDGPNGLLSADFNDDDLADLAVANFSGTSISVLYGQQGGGFSAASDYTVGSRPCGIASGDVDGDDEVRRIVGKEYQTPETWTWSSSSGTSFSSRGVTVSIL